MSYYFKIIILAEICIKMRYFYWKIAKNSAGGSASRPPLKLPSIDNSWLRHCS